MSYSRDTSNLHSHLKSVHKNAMLKTDDIENCIDENDVDDPSSMSYFNKDGVL